MRSGEAYERRTQELIATERSHLLTALAEWGCGVIPGEANYVLARAPGTWSASVPFNRRLDSAGFLYVAVLCTRG